MTKGLTWPTDPSRRCLLYWGGWWNLKYFLNSMENKPCCSWDRTGWGPLIDGWLPEPLEMGQAPVWVLGIQSLPSWGSHSSLHMCPPSLWEDIRKCTGTSDVDVFPPKFLLCYLFLNSSYMNRASLVAQTIKNLHAVQETQVWSLGFRKIPWRKYWHPTPVILPEESHRQRSLAGTVHGVTKSRTQLSN